MARLRIYDLLPSSIRDSDPDQALKALIDSAQQEMDRDHEQATGLAVLIDAHGINRTFLFEGTGSFDFIRNPEQLLIGKITGTDTVQIVAPVVAQNSFFVGYGLRVLRKKYDPNNDGIYEEDNDSLPDDLQNFYCKIVAYDGPTQTATVYPPFPAEGQSPTANYAFELAFPQFLYLPATDAKGRQVAQIPNAYRDWWVRIVGGPGGSPIQTRRIVSYFVKQDINGTPIGYILSTDTAWDFPPVATSQFGITSHFVSLNYLARNVGFDLDGTDPEELQRQQILNAVSVSKMKGTKRSFQRLFRTLGFSATVSESTVNYVGEPTEEVGVQEPAQVKATSGVNIGTPLNLNMVNVQTDFTDDFSYLSAPTYFSKWNNGVTLVGPVTATIEAGQMRIDFSGANEGAYVSRNFSMNESYGVVAEFDFQILGSVPASTEVVLLKWVDPGSGGVAFVGFKNASRQLIYNTGTGSSVIAGSFALGSSDTSFHHMKVWANPAGGGGYSTTLNIQVDGTDVFSTPVTFFSTISSFGDVELRFGVTTVGTAFACTSRLDNFMLGTPVNELIASGGGEDDMFDLAFRDTAASGILDPDDPIASPAYYRPNLGLRIPESDIVVFLRRLHPGVRFSSEILPRLRARMEDIRPIHVEIAIIGVAVEGFESLAVTDSHAFGMTFSELVTIDDGISLLPSALTNTESLLVYDTFYIIRPNTRWDGGDVRWDMPLARWDSST